MTPLTPIGDMATATMTEDEGPDMPDSGISRYEFEQDVIDSWGSNDGTDNSSAGYTSNSVVGDYAKSLDGNNDYVQLPMSIANEYTDFSICFWINADAFNSGYFVDESDGAANYAVRIAPDTSSGDLFVYNSGGTFTGISTSEIPQTGTWEHIVATVEDSVEIAIYLNGSHEESATIGGVDRSPSNASVGNRVENDTEYNGDMDDLRFYSKPLSDTEVFNLYNTGSING